MYKLFLCLRYLRKRRIAFFAVAAVSLCVAMVLIVVSVMGGFLQMVKDHSRGLLGDLVMENQTLQGFPYYQDFIDEIKTDPVIGEQIVEATPVIITYGVARFSSDMLTKAIQVVGIRLEETYRVNNFKVGLFYDKYYPGTTTFAEQALPCFGLNQHAKEILPPDLEAAYRKWAARASPAEIEDVPIDDRLGYKRPGYYRAIPLDDEPESLEPKWIGPELPGIILGRDLCAWRKTRDERQESKGGYIRRYWRGEKVALAMLPMTDTGAPQDAILRRELFRYTDDSRTGVYDIDSASVYVDFDRLQGLLNMDELIPDEGDPRPARATQIQIKVAPGFDPLETQRLITEHWTRFVSEHIAECRVPSLLTSVQIRTWEEKQAHFIGAVEKEKVLVTTLFGVISLVAVFLVGCIFYMIVQQNTRDIGIIKSVGATSTGVAGIFVSYGAAVGVVGGAIGSVIGTLFVRYINEIQDGLAWLNPAWVIWDPSVYTFDRIPNAVSSSDLVVIYGVAIIASMFGSLMAAVRAARVWPVEALRYE